MKKTRVRTILIVVVILLLVLAGVVLVNRLPKNNSECKLDSDCIKAQTNCCPCSSGGGEKCIPAKDSEKYKLDCNNVNKFCIEVYNCNIEKCRCVEGKCAG